MEKKIKIGLDIHGVANNMKNPDFWPWLTELIVANGGEVHIMTGRAKGARLDEKIKKLGLWYTHIYSVIDDLRERGVPITDVDPNNPWVDEKYWNAAKGRYASEQELDMVIDDEIVYVPGFTTPIAIMFTNTGKRWVEGNKVKIITGKYDGHYGIIQKVKQCDSIKYLDVTQTKKFVVKDLTEESIVEEYYQPDLELQEYSANK